MPIIDRRYGPPYPTHPWQPAYPDRAMEEIMRQINAGPHLHTCSDEELEAEVERRKARKQRELEESIKKLEQLGYKVEKPEAK